VPDPRRFGVVRDGDGVITALHRSPTAWNNLAVIGLCYVRDGAALIQACRN
jgi:hypothetical protein